jgi:hypothetical protein
LDDAQADGRMNGWTNGYDAKRNDRNGIAASHFFFFFIFSLLYKLIPFYSLFYDDMCLEKKKYTVV